VTGFAGSSKLQTSSTREVSIFKHQRPGFDEVQDDAILLGVFLMLEV
jgi:hypothetical protein